MSVSPNTSDRHPVPAPPLNLDVSMPELTRALLAHTDNEHVSFSQLTRCHADLRAWLLSDRDED